jgi:uncharacterized protein (DUF58 family)
VAAHGPHVDDGTGLRLAFRVRLAVVALTVTLVLLLPAASLTATSTSGISLVTYPTSQTVADGGTATFTIVVRNSGDVELTRVAVGDGRSQNCNRRFAQLPAGASFSYTCRHSSVTKAFDSVATLSGSAPEGRQMTASDHATVMVTHSAAQRTTSSAKATKRPRKRPRKRPPRPVIRPYRIALTG